MKAEKAQYVPWSFLDMVGLELLKDDECLLNFLHIFQRKWKEETGNAWNANNTTESLLKPIVKKSLPQQMQKKLEEVEGLMKMDWPFFQNM